MLAVNEVVQQFVDISYGEKKPTIPAEQDNVHDYARNVMSSGLLLMEFIDAIREADGNRNFRCWKYFLLHFKEAHRTNYSLEAFTLLAQYYILLSPRMAAQLKWNRTINIHGRPGKNVPCDLHLEHLNKEAKQSISGLGSNITDHAVQRIGKSLGHTVHIMKRFDLVNKIKEPSNQHSRRSTAKDMKLLLKELSDSRVFHKVEGRKHINLSAVPSNPIKHISIPDITAWMKLQFKKLVTYQAT